MAEKDMAEKLLEDYNDVFADIVNVLVFGGERTVKENELCDTPLRSQYKADDSCLHEQERDVAKSLKEDNGMRPRATDVKPLDDYKLYVTFDNGEHRIFDVKPLIFGEWFGQLLDPEVFKTVHVAGLSVEWCGRQDICPDELYYDSVPV